MKRKTGPKSTRPPVETFIKLYYDENISVDEIAKMYGVKRQTVYNWAAKIKSNK